jgi:hypothetical protein
MRAGSVHALHLFELPEMNPSGLPRSRSEGAAAGNAGSGALPHKLTRSAAAERKRIRAIFERAALETTLAILASGWNELTPAHRRKQKADSEAFERAATCLRRALDETEEG